MPVLKTPGILKPIYTAENLNGAAYQLRYTWCGWATSGTQIELLTRDELLKVKELWEADGLRLLKHKWSPEAVQLAFSTKPYVSPILLAARAKGRLQHALRACGKPVSFSRKLSVRSFGDAARTEVEKYVQQQVEKTQYHDTGFKQALSRFSTDDPTLDLSLPLETESGRYWYNLHIVLVRNDRQAGIAEHQLEKLRDTCLKVAAKKGYGLSRMSVLPDHIHMALRGTIDSSPQDIALVYLNNLAYVMGQNAVWQFSYYAGTFGEYSMGAIR